MTVDFIGLFAVLAAANVRFLRTKLPSRQDLGMTTSFDPDRIPEA